MTTELTMETIIDIAQTVSITLAVVAIILALVALRLSNRAIALADKAAAAEKARRLGKLAKPYVPSYGPEWYWDRSRPEAVRARAQMAISHAKLPFVHPKGAEQ